LTYHANYDNYVPMAQSKNNPSVRQPQAKKYYQGQELKAAMYVGTSVGKGRYLAGAVNGELICDHTGKPVPYRAIPLDNLSKEDTVQS